MQVDSDADVRHLTRAFQRLQDVTDASEWKHIAGKELNCRSVLDLIDGGRIPQLRKTVAKSVYIPSVNLPSLRISFGPITLTEDLKLTDILCIVPSTLPQHEGDGVGTIAGETSTSTSRPKKSQRTSLISLQSQSHYQSSSNSKGIESYSPTRTWSPDVVKRIPCMASAYMVDTVHASDTGSVSLPPLHKNRSSVPLRPTSNNFGPKPAGKQEKLTPVSAKMVRAMLLMTTSKESPEHSRYLFEAGVLFDEVGMHEKALFCFQQARRKGSIKLIVDLVHVPHIDGLDRRLQRMCDKHREKLLQDREKRREDFARVEEARYRLRNFICVLQIIRIQLIMGNFADVHEHMREAFAFCTNDEEHDFNLNFIHALLAAMSARNFEEMDLSQQVYSGTPGPLGEAHIQILEELLAKDSMNPDLLEWLARRYAEQGDFTASRQHYKRARLLRDGNALIASVRLPHQSAASFAPLVGRRAKGAVRNTSNTVGSSSGEGRGEDRLGNEQPGHVDVSLMRDVRKLPVEHYKTIDELLEEEEKKKNRVDHTWPEGAHGGANTVIYSVPLRGWESSVTRTGAPGRHSKAKES